MQINHKLVLIINEIAVTYFQLVASIFYAKYVTLFKTTRVNHFLIKE